MVSAKSKYSGQLISRELAQRLGVPEPPTAAIVFATQVKHETADMADWALGTKNNNPLNLTGSNMLWQGYGQVGYYQGGSTSEFHNNFARFDTLENGCRACAANYLGRYYPNVIAAYKSGNPISLAQAIQDSPWDSGHYGGRLVAEVQAELSNYATPQPAPTSAQPTGDFISYTVQPGDTLSKIGAKFGVPWQTITGYKSGNPNLIYVGEVLAVPKVAAPAPVEKPSETSTTYVVKSGDTLSAIASQYGVGVGDISGYKSGNPNLIYPGEVLTIKLPTPPTPQPTPEPPPVVNPTPKPAEEEKPPVSPPIAPSGDEAEISPSEVSEPEKEPETVSKMPILGKGVAILAILKDFIQRITSRKFLLAVGTIVGISQGNVTDAVGTDVANILKVLVALVYIIVQGWAEAEKNKTI